MQTCLIYRSVFEMEEWFIVDGDRTLCRIKTNLLFIHLINTNVFWDWRVDGAVGGGQGEGRGRGSVCDPVAQPLSEGPPGGSIASAVCSLSLQGKCGPKSVLRFVFNGWYNHHILYYILYIYIYIYYIYIHIYIYVYIYISYITPFYMDFRE